MLSNDNFGSILPTVKPQQFSDTFSGFTLFVEKKLNNELQNIFLHDSMVALIIYLQIFLIQLKLQLLQKMD